MDARAPSGDRLRERTAPARFPHPPPRRRRPGGVRASPAVRLNAVLAGLIGAIVALLFAHGRHSPYDNYVLLADQMLHGRLWIDAVWPGPEIDAVLFDGHRFVVNDPVPALLLLPLVAFAGTHANQTLLACLLCGV